MKIARPPVQETSAALEPGLGAQLGWILAPLLLVTAGCMSTEMRDAHESGQVSTSTGAPDWVGTPLSWNKLERLGHWLEYEAQGYDSAWRVQAELTLGEGRLVYARREKPAVQPTPAWLSRLRSAQASFERVLDDPMRSASQENRARQAMREITELRTGTVAASATTNNDHISRAQWRAKAPRPTRLDAALGGFDRITIHHTANVPGTRFDGTLNDSVTVMQKVQREHMSGRGYGDIGYHFLIDAKGRVFDGRDMRYQGAHAGGVNNQRNIGICLIGNFEYRGPSVEAMRTLNSMLRSLRSEHGIRRTRIVGHGELKATECPGPVLGRWTKQYREAGPRLSQLNANEAGAGRIAGQHVAQGSRPSSVSTWQPAAAPSTVR